MQTQARSWGGALSGAVVAVVCAAAGLAVTALSVGPLAGPFFMFQFAFVVGAAQYRGLGPGLLATALCALGSYRMFFWPALERFEAYRLASFVGVSAFFAWLAARVRHAKAAAEVACLRAEAAEAQARLVGAQQERLVAVVSHDLRNPLNAIALTAEGLREVATSEREHRSLGRILASTRRMQSIVRDLLDYACARHGAGLPVHREAVRVGEVCRAAVEELKAAHPRSAIVVEMTGDDAATLDPARVEQVVCNLVSNALKHGDAGAPVSVLVTGDAEGVRIDVTNSGAAIPPHVRSSLFDPFRRGAASGSVGLGLFIVREIAHAHGGTASVRSAERRTTFTVAFPRSGASAPAKVAAA